MTTRPGPPDPKDVAIEIDVIHCFTLLNGARASTDPRSRPIALIVRDDARAAERLLRALGEVSLFREEREALSCAWIPRAQLLQALRSVEPLEALRLAKAAATDGLLWTIVHAGETCRVAEHGKRGPVSRAAEKELLSFIHVCGNTSGIDENDHDWEDREIRREEDGEVVDDTTCTRCGFPYDDYARAGIWETLDDYGPVEWPAVVEDAQVAD